MTVDTAALDLAMRGWPVFPVKRDKQPHTPHGLKDATTDPERIAEWWRRWPDAGVAIRTGSPSGLVVLDVDPRHGGDDALHELELEHGELPETVRAVTGGGGGHFYFAHPGKEVRNSVGVLGEGLDIRADEGYCVAPPSPHENGRRYEWDVPPAEAELAPLPAWLLAKRRNGGTPDRVGKTIPHGQQHRTLVSFAGTMRRRGGGESEIAAALKVMNRERCEKPGTDSEIEKIARSVCNYAPAQQSGGEDGDRLAELLGLPAVGVEITDVKMFGQGAGASIDIRLSNGETMGFQSVREMVRPQYLIAELVACAGATPELKQPQAVQVVKLARTIAERVQLDSEDATSREWGVEFLQQNETLDFALDNQVERWRAFELLSERDPWNHARTVGCSFASGCIALRDASGALLVRSEWFLRYVRTMVPRETPATLRTRMARVGWQRRGSEGRIKATAPGRVATLQWSFWIVPAGWGEEQENERTR